MNKALTTAFVLDKRYLEHDAMPNHPERPERIAALLDLVTTYKRQGLSRVDPRPATEEEITANHDGVHFEAVRNTRGQSSHVFDSDTATGAATFDTALLAAGGLLVAIDEVMEGRADNAFAMVRPPGHHAERNRAMGFCFFNNVAVGARYLRRVYGLERVLIVDWDVHHGNGTQASFYEDPNVLFVSSHQYPFYPGTGAADEIGAGDGAGFTLNAPIPAGCGDIEYLDVYRRLVGPVARAFDPQFVLVSAGYDAHRLDPLGGMEVTDDGFAAIAATVLAIAREHAGGRCAVVLEGGYSLEGLKGGVRATLDALAGTTKVPSSHSGGRTTALVESLIVAQRRFWNL